MSQNTSPSKRKLRSAGVNTVQGEGESTWSWIGSACDTRPALQQDLTFEDQEEYWPEEDNGNGEIQVTFYSGIRRSSVKLVGGKARNPNKVQQEGDFKIGDTVTIANSNVRKHYLGVIIAIYQINFGENDDEKDQEPALRVKVHYFLRPHQLPSTGVTRSFKANEIFYELGDKCSPVPFHSILHHFQVASTPLDVYIKSPQKPNDRGWTYIDGQYREQYYCQHAVNAHRGLFYKFSWPDFRREALAIKDDEGVPWMGMPWALSGEEVREAGTMTSSSAARSRAPKRGRAPSGGSPRKRMKSEPEQQEIAESEDDSGDEYNAESHVDEDEDDEEVVDAEDDEHQAKDSDEDAPKTPRKGRRGRPCKIAIPTPASKAALRARASPKKKMRAPPSQFVDGLALAKLPQDPWLRAMHALHVGARPDALPCRDSEYTQVLQSVEDILEEGSGGCVYISGVPGTGKTATVHAVVRELKRMAEQKETNPFTYVEINGLRIPEPQAAYTLLWEAISGHNATTDGQLKTSSKEALRQLTRFFGAGAQSGPGGHACVVLMDELDQLVTKKQDVVYNFFNWPMLAGSKLIVIAVANTMDLPERVMTGRVRSRLGMVRINFQPYTQAQLEAIVKARLGSVKEGMSKDNKDVKVLMDEAIKMAAIQVANVSGDARRALDICRRTVELVHPQKRAAKISDVKATVKAMQNSPVAAYLKDCSFHERLMLASLIKCIKREGVEDIKWDEVCHQHMNYLPVLSRTPHTATKPTAVELSMVLDSLVAARAVVFEQGATASRKAFGDRRMLLNVEQGDVERVLSEVGGESWKNLLSV